MICHKWVIWNDESQARIHCWYILSNHINAFFQQHLICKPLRSISESEFQLHRFQALLALLSISGITVTFTPMLCISLDLLESMFKLTRTGRTVLPALYFKLFMSVIMKYSESICCLRSQTYWTFEYFYLIIDFTHWIVNYYFQSLIDLLTT
jgi:hypothetical protein